MPKKSSIKPATLLSNEQIALQGIDFFNKKKAIKELEGQCKELRGPLEDALSISGHDTPSGSKVLVVPHADVDVHIKNTLRVGKVLLPEAIDILKDAGLNECIEKVEMVREDVVERLYDAGKISDEMLQKIYASKPSFAFSVDVKKRSDV